MHALKSGMIAKRRLLGASLAALLTCPLAWAQDPAGGFIQPPVGGMADAGGTSSQAQRPDQVLTIGETITLRHPSGKNIKEILISKSGILSDVTPIDPKVPNIYGAKGQSQGVTQVTLVVDGEQPATLTVRVDPDITYIRSVVAKTFPTANVSIIPGGNNIGFIVTGWVESPEDVEPLINFLRGFVPNRRREDITMGVKVAGVQQVQLEVCLARVNRTEAREMGFSFGYGGNETIFGSALPPAVGATAGNFAPAAQSVTNLLGGATSTGTNLHLGIVGDNKAFLGLLQALRNESLSKVLANPTLSTMSGRPSEFLVGGELPAVTTGGGGGSGSGGSGGGAIQFRQFGTRVTFLPVVLGDGKIRIQVQAEVSQPDPTQSVSTQFFNAPAFIINSVQSTVELENGQTFVVGGLIQTERGGTADKVPVLGDLPFLGAAFRHVRYIDRETELVVAVTATLVDPLDKSQRPRVLPGEETRNPTDFELFMEGILEAPRGCRDPFPCKTYVPAFKLDAPFGCPMGHCDSSKLWHKDGCGSCGTGACGTGGCVTGGCASCGTATVGAPMNAVPAQAAPAQPMPNAPAGAIIRNGSNATMIAPPLPAEPKLTIVPASAPAAPAAPVVPAVVEQPKAEAIPALPEAAKVVPPLPERK